jgi:hypothetical protein
VRGMSDDLGILFDRIRVLLERHEAERQETADAVEHTLTDGYARALALDGERQLRGLLGSLAETC